MPLKRGPNGGVLRLPGSDSLMIAPTGDCCCGGDDGPTCCYNAQCQVVPCDSPDAVGGIVACEPCEASNLNFCGYCPPNLETEIPANYNATVTPNDPPLVDTSGICGYVEFESVESRMSANGTVDRSDSIAVDIEYQLTQTLSTEITFRLRNDRPNASLWSMEIFVFSLPRDGNHPDIRIRGIDANLLPANIDGWDFSVEASTRLSNIVYGPLDRTNCTRQVSYDYDISYEVIITDLNGVAANLTDGSNSATGSLSRVIDYSGDDCGRRTVFLNRSFIGTSVSTDSEIGFVATGKPYVNTDPTCNT